MRTARRPDLAEFLMGVSVAVAFGLPFLGRLGPVPMSTLAFLAPGMSLAAFLFLPRNARAWNPYAAGVLMLLAAYVALVAVSASSSQFAFFLVPANWLARSGQYYEAKLVTFAVAALPGLLAALPLLFVRPSEHVLRGFLGAALVIALLAVMRVLPYASLLAGTDHMQAREIVANPYGVGFSVVSIGILCCVGAAASLAFKRTWPLAALFLFIAFWINRRTETALITVMLAAYAGHYFWVEGSWRGAARSAMALSAALFVAAILHNEANLTTWVRVSASVAERTEILSKAMVSKEPSASAATDVQQESKAQPALRTQDSVLHGRGLGWYATLGGEHPYPHNLYLETFKESGAVAAVVLIAALCLSLVAVTSGALSSPYFGITMALAALVAVSVKAGDISTAGRMFPLLVLSAFLHPSATSHSLKSYMSRTTSTPVG